MRATSCKDSPFFAAQSLCVPTTATTTAPTTARSGLDITDATMTAMPAISAMPTAIAPTADGVGVGVGFGVGFGVGVDVGVGVAFFFSVVILRAHAILPSHTHAIHSLKTVTVEQLRRARSVIRGTFFF